MKTKGISFEEQRMKIVAVDMDGVLCDYKTPYLNEISELNPFPQSRPGFFLNLEPIPGAIEGVKLLQQWFDVRILTRPSFRNLHCFTEKAQWVEKHLGYEMLEKLIIAGDKSLMIGDYLIDDTNNAKQSEFRGKWIEFGTEQYPSWEGLPEYILEDSKKSTFRAKSLLEWDANGYAETMNGGWYQITSHSLVFVPHGTNLINPNITLVNAPLPNAMMKDIAQTHHNARVDARIAELETELHALKSKWIS